MDCQDLAQSWHHESCSVIRVPLSVTPWTTAHQASLSFTISWNFLKLMSIESMMPSSCLILCLPHLLLPSIFPSTRVYSIESVLCIRWPKYLGFSFSISPSSEYSGSISFRIDWFDLLAVQWTISSVAQSYPTLCDPMDHSMPGLPVHHQLPEFTQTYVC